MPKAKNPFTPQEQHARFVKGARELGLDTPEAEAEFERAVRKIAGAPTETPPPKKKSG